MDWTITKQPKVGEKSIIEERTAKVKNTHVYIYVRAHGRVHAGIGNMPTGARKKSWSAAADGVRLAEEWIKQRLGICEDEVCEVCQ